MQEHVLNTQSKSVSPYNIKALLSFWGHSHASDIQAISCRNYVAAREVKDSTAARELAVLSATIHHDYRMGRLSHVVPVTLPRLPPPKDRWLTREEAASLLSAARSRGPQARHIRLFVLLALYTGARKGALLQLRWPQIDLDRRLIHLNPVNRVQTSKQRPTIPLSPRLVSILQAARRRSSDTGFVISYEGKPVKDIKKGFAAACRQAGLEGVTPHTLRHTAGTWMAQAGVPLWQIGGMLGHSSQAMTQKYAHHSPDYLRAAVLALGNKK